MPRRICCSANDTPEASTRTSAWPGPTEPVPGYDAHQEALVEASQQPMEALLAVLGDGAAGAPPPALRRELAAWATSRGLDVEPAAAHRAIVVWSRLHGIVSLEIQGNFASMGLDPELLFEAEVAALPS